MSSEYIPEKYYDKYTGEIEVYRTEPEGPSGIVATPWGIAPYHGQYPPRGITFNSLVAGEAPLVIAAKNVIVTEQVKQALASLVRNIGSAEYWENFFSIAMCGTAGPCSLFVMDRRNNFYRVQEVELDPGGHSGYLRVMHLGKKSRHGRTLEVDIQEAMGYMVPLIVYK